MATNDEQTEGDFVAAFQRRLIEIQGKRSDADMAELLEIPTDRYKKYKKRVGSGFPIYLLPRLRKIAGTSYADLVENLDRAPQEQPKRKGKKAAA